MIKEMRVLLPIRSEDSENDVATVTLGKEIYVFVYFSSIRYWPPRKGGVFLSGESKISEVSCFNQRFNPILIEYGSVNDSFKT